MSIWRDMQRDIQYSNMVGKIIILNIAVFLLVHILFLPFFLLMVRGHDAYIEIWQNLFAIKANPADFIFKPWTFVTYMFLHFDPMHILFNLLALYVFGRILNSFLSDRQVLAIYVYGGILGAIFYILTYNIFPRFAADVFQSRMFGASAGVMSVILAIATLAPNFSLVLIRPIPLKYVALVFVLLDLSSIGVDNSGGHISHLGGGLMGYLFIREMRKGNDYSIYLEQIINYCTKKIKLFLHWLGIGAKNKKPKMKATINPTAQKGTHIPDLNTKNWQEKIDAILDKIKRSGYDSLTKEEKEILFKASNK